MYQNETLKKIANRLLMALLVSFTQPALAVSISSVCFNGTCDVTVNGVTKTILAQSVSSEIIKGQVYINGMAWNKDSSASKVNKIAPKVKIFSHVELCDGSPGSKHPNGGGFVATTAKVSPTAYISEDSMICDRAEVSGSAQVESSNIGGRASIGGSAKVTKATIYGRTKVSGSAKINGVELTKGKFAGIEVVE